MKIILISTSTYPSDQGIRTIASTLKKHKHQVEIVFMSLTEDYSQNYSHQELSQLVDICKGSDLIGVNSYASTSKRAERILKFLKQEFKIPIIYGGVHVTISPEECIKYSDIICVGEGEETIIDVVNAIEKNKSIDKIKNLWIRKGNKVIKNQVRDLVDDIDKIPFPDYEIEDHYILEKGKIRRFLESDLGGQIFFLTGRGCPYGCDYCSNGLINELYKGKRKRILRWNSPKYIIEGVLYLKNKFPSLSYFDIRDDTFSLRSLKDIQEFCKLYKEKVGMRFKCLADPKTVTDDKVRLLVDAGCTDIIMGIQGSERANMEIYHRYQTDADILRSAKIFNKYKDKLAVMYDVITSNPYETADDILNLIKLIIKLPKPFFLSVNNLVFFPGTQLYTRAKQDGIIKTEEDSAAQLNYWDRAKHIKLKKKNIYLNLVINLMRGVVTEKRYGIIPVNILKNLIQDKRVERNLNDTSLSYFILNFIEFGDFLREKAAKPMFRALPLNVKTWYDKIRYRV